MDLIQIFWLAFIQGLTEFLPISSSAHLILPSELLGWQDQGLAFDVAVHIGSLSAVMCYFRKDIIQLVSAWFASFTSKGPSPESKLGWAMILATIPVGLAGLLLDSFVETHLRSMTVIAVTTIVFGLLLGLVDKTASQSKGLQQLGFMTAILIGCSQVLALIPGTSRSGITMTTALALGFDRTAAARFSFLLSIPVIVLSGGYKAWQLLGTANVDWFAMLIGASISALTAFVCIYLFLKWIERVGMMPFVWYRMALGLLLIGYELTV